MKAIDSARTRLRHASDGTRLAWDRTATAACRQGRDWRHTSNKRWEQARSRTTGFFSPLLPLRGGGAIEGGGRLGGGGEGWARWGGALSIDQWATTSPAR